MVLSPPPENALINSLISGGKLPKGKSTMFLVHILKILEEIQWTRLGSSFKSVPSRLFLFLSCKSEYSDMYCCSVFWGILTLRCVSCFTQSSLTLLIPVLKYIFISSELERRWGKKHIPEQELGRVSVNSTHYWVFTIAST